MATNEELQLKIGTEEAVSLKPAKVKILEVSIEEVGSKKAKKVVCLVKHPEASENIRISAVKYENKAKGKLETAGLWINKDSKGLIRKGSALAVFMALLNATIIGELANREVETVTDEKGYLCFKAY